MAFEAFGAGETGDGFALSGQALAAQFEHAMLVSQVPQGGEMNARPMALVEVTESGKLLFVTHLGTNKVDEVLRHPERREAYRAEVQSRGKDKGAGPGSAEPDKALVALKKGEIWLGRKDYKRAEGHFRDATLFDAGNARAWVLLGWTTYLNGNTRSSVATKTIEKALRLEPKNADAWYYLGRMAILKKDPDRARRRFAKALEGDPKHVGAQRELRLLDRRQGGEPEKPGTPRGGLRGLFGRRKDEAN